jgi:Mg2+ and Co2+ transporter CorA
MTEKSGGVMDNSQPRDKPPTLNDKTDLEDPKKALREKINLVLPDSLMIALALVMIPIVVIPLFTDLSPSISQTFHMADYTIIAIFIIEYFLKMAVAPNILRFVVNPWRLLDLLVIVLPFFDLLQLAGGFGRWSPMLRLLRLTRIVAVGGRAIDRKVAKHSAELPRVSNPPAMKIKTIDREMDNISDSVSLKKVAEYLTNNSQTWIDISSVSERDLNDISGILGIPHLVLESELVEESYPRIDYFESYSMIFARVADMGAYELSAGRVSVSRAGLLVICCGQNIITISKTDTGLFSRVLEQARKFSSQSEHLVVSILYTILKYSLDKDNQVINAIEHELMVLENIPLKNRPSSFLESTFYLKKEVNQLVPSLLHMKEMAAMITAKRVPLDGFQEKHERLFDILADEATYLKETAENARDNLLSLIDLYINTKSFELNKVMRLVAVITSLSIIPAVGGMFGSNLIGNPWNIELWQLFCGLFVLMLAGLWIFLRLGWLKG